MDLLPTKEYSKLLDKAWRLDQEALLCVKDRKETFLLWQESIKICKNLLKKFPKDINLLLKTATIYQHQKKFDKARYYLYKAKKIYSNNFLIEHNLGNLYRAKGNVKLAIKYYQLAVGHSKGNELIKKSLRDYERVIQKKENKKKSS